MDQAEAISIARAYASAHQRQLGDLSLAIAPISEEQLSEVESRMEKDSPGSTKAIDSFVRESFKTHWRLTFFLHDAYRPQGRRTLLTFDQEGNATESLSLLACVEMESFHINSVTGEVSEYHPPALPLWYRRLWRLSAWWRELFARRLTPASTRAVGE